MTDQRHCPCSVREQPPTPAQSNQERTSNGVKFSAATAASRSLLPPPADYESDRRGGVKSTWCLGNPWPSQHLPEIRTSTQFDRVLSCSTPNRHQNRHPAQGLSRQ